MQLSTGNVKADINVTPLVDVVLVLLIIFMVVTPMLQRGEAVTLPKTLNPAKKPDDKDQILVAMKADKMLSIEKGTEKEKNITEAQFSAKIKEAFDRNPGSTIVIKADSRLSYGDVKKTMMKIKEAGYASVGLITEKKEKT